MCEMPVIDYSSSAAIFRPRLALEVVSRSIEDSDRKSVSSASHSIITTDLMRLQMVFTQAECSPNPPTCPRISSDNELEGVG